MKLPDYCEYAGPALTLAPPFQFSNVMVASFPMRADLDTLQRFIDSYLNIVPPEIANFRVSMPYVYMMLLDYGRLSNQKTNFGCFSQREVLFYIPLEQYKRVGERWVFQDWASVTPFIYVDGQISLTLGRTAMGWPKSIVKVTPELTGWLQDPDGLTTDLSISADVLPETYEGARMQERPVIMVRSPMQSSLRVPFDPGSAMTPWGIWGNLARSMTGLAQDYFSLLKTSGLLPPNEMSSSENFARKLRSAMGVASQSLPWAPNASFNSINLKQFRSAEDPRVPCYQALTSGPLRYTAFMGGGLLGSQLGDASGGYVVDLACWPTFPIVDALGIQADTYEITGAPKIARVKPVFPFWYEVNMEYALTSTLAFRGQDGQWRDDEGDPIGKPTPKKQYYFNTTIGAASPVITGPFEFTSATIRVLSVQASIDRMQKYIEEFLNKPLESVGERFEVWCAPEGASAAGKERYSSLYLTVVDWGDVTSETNSIGDWADTTLTFYIPVKRFKDDKLVGVGLFPAYSYADGTMHTCTLTELYGVPTTEGTFIRASCEPGDLERRREFNVLRLMVESLPALHEGQMVETKVLLDIVDTGHKTFDAKEKTGEVGMLGEGLAVYTLKQFRDVSQSDSACYQALVAIPHTIRVHEFLEVPREAEIRLYRRSMHPICSKLGLLSESDARAGRGAGEQIVKVDRWLVLDADIWIGNGTQLYERIGTTKWTGKDSKVAQPVPSPEKLDHGPDELMTTRLSRFPSHPPPPWTTL